MNTQSLSLIRRHISSCTFAALITNQHHKVHQNKATQQIIPMHIDHSFVALLTKYFLIDQDGDSDQARHQARVDEMENFYLRRRDDDEDDDLSSFIILFAAVFKSQQEFIHSRYKKAFHKSLSQAMRRIRDRRIPRISLQQPGQSSWDQLYISRNNQTLVTLTGFDHAAFNWLLNIFEPVYEQYSPGDNSPDGCIVRIRHPNQGRPRLMSAADCLGLNLAWTGLRGSTTSLQLVFGMTGSRISKWLCFGRRILIAILCNHPEAAVRIPSGARIRQFKAAIHAKHPRLMDVWCTMDGLKLSIQQSGDSHVQNLYYNGWTHDHYVSSVLVFCPDGTIPIAAINFPGSFHDSQIAEWGKIYTKLEHVYHDNGGQCVVDSAFARNRYNFLIKSAQADPIDMEEALLNREATAMRQASEWGMRALQSSFPRLKDRMRFEETGERKIIMKMLILLFNVHSRRVGINQVLNTYMPALQLDANSVKSLNQS